MKIEPLNRNEKSINTDLANTPQETNRINVSPTSPSKPNVENNGNNLPVNNNENLQYIFDEKKVCEVQGKSRNQLELIDEQITAAKNNPLVEVKQKTSHIASAENSEQSTKEVNQANTVESNTTTSLTDDEIKSNHVSEEDMATDVSSSQKLLMNKKQDESPIEAKEKWWKIDFNIRPWIAWLSPIVIMIAIHFYTQSLIVIEKPEKQLGEKVVIHLPTGNTVYTYENLIVNEKGKFYYEGERNTIDLTGGELVYEDWE